MRVCRDLSTGIFNAARALRQHYSAAAVSGSQAAWAAWQSTYFIVRNAGTAYDAMYEVGGVIHAAQGHCLADGTALAATHITLHHACSHALLPVHVYQSG